MYLDHWGLARPPFRDDGDETLHFAGESFEAALLKMRYVVENALGAGLFVGETGTGKTHLTRLLASRLAADRGPVVRLVFPRATPEEFLADLAGELEPHAHHEVASARGTRVAVEAPLRRVLRALDRLAEAGRHPVLVVDEVHLVADPPLLHALHLLLNHQPRVRLDFTLLLVGLPGVIPRIERVPQLNERIAVRGLVRRLTADETAAYVRHRLEAAGGRADVFEPAATTALYECSGGLPRRVNRLCDMALLVGCVDRLPSIGRAVIEGVAEELVAVRAA